MATYIRSHAVAAKTMTYSAMHMLVAVAVAYTISGSWVVAFSIGLIEPVVQTVAYHFHEKSWRKFLGRKA